MIYFPHFLRTSDDFTGQYLKDGTQLLFHHIPKTAGSTMRGILETLVNPEQVCPAETVQELDSIPEDELKQYRVFAGHFSYGVINKVLPNAIWITFLREPNERVISQYHNHLNNDRIPDNWKQRIEENPQWKQYMEEIQGCTLEEWITHPNKWANSITCNRQVQAFLPQDIRVKVDDWSIYNKDLLNLAKKNLESRFSFVGIQEYFDLSFTLFSATFGLIPLTGFDSFTTNLNTKKKFGSRYDVDEKLGNLLTKRNSMDWELYEFGSKLFLSRLNRIMCNYVHADRRNRIEKHLRHKESSSRNEWCIDEVLGIKGFYALEQGNDHAFRWTGADEISSIEIDKELSSDKQYFIEVTVLAFIEDNIADSVALTFDSYKVCNAKIKKNWLGSGAKISFVTDKNSINDGRYHVIEIKSDLVSEDESRKDARLLGLAIHNVKITDK